MADTVRCPVCGASNPDTLERCRACNQLLNQSTTELNGFGDRIASGQTPTEKSTSELESALPAWLRRARQTDQGDIEETPEKAPQETTEPDDEVASTSEADEAPIFPDFSEDDDDEEDIDSADWLAGLSDSADDDDDEEEAADWLVNLQGDLASDDEPVVEEAPAESTPKSLFEGDEAPVQDDDLPNWMSNLQAESSEAGDDLPDLIPQEDSGFDADNLPGEDGTPDWLSRLSDESESASETPASDPAPVPQANSQPSTFDTDDGLPDWMSDLQSVGEVTEGDIPTPLASEPVASINEIPAEPSDELPDWVTNLQAAEASPAPEESIVSAASDDLPDWLSGDEPASEGAPAEANDDLPDWMSSLGAEETAQTPEEAPATPSASGDLPDWMSEDEPASEATPVESGDDLPDWMSSLGTEETAEATEEAPATPSVSGDLPDWLSGDESASEATPADVGDDLPDWLSSLQQDANQPAAVSQQEDDSLTEASAQASESPFGDVEIPVEDSDVPDWLSRMGKPTTGSLSSVELDNPEISPALEAADEAPEWLDVLPGIDDLKTEDAALEKSDAALPMSPAFVDDNISAGDDDDEIFGIDMPDWLSNLAPEDLGATDEGALISDGDAMSASAEIDLSGAELPSWVQAMRPVESVVSGSGNDEIEQVSEESGPLAGLNGILPIGMGLGLKSKPQAHSIKLRVNESQQTSAALLERILESEGEAAAKTSDDAPVSIPLLRWVIAGLMVLIVTVSLLMPQEIKIVPSPSIAVPEIGDTLGTIKALPDGGTVLLVFDYEAALSAELQAAAGPVVDHIMLRGQKLALLSSTPNGPALAENFLKETQSQHNYQLGADYLNLGYLPGGASGMLSFVSAPRSAVTGQLDGQSFWAQPPLINIAKITDFSAVLILTDDVEKGRTWIEQASATLNAASTPILMVVSAQAEPIIYPYYASGQVDGLVSGLNGGATYEILQGKTDLGLGLKYWDAYSIGLFSAEILIVIGAVLNFMAGLRARQKTEEEEQE